jgi:hypothetical protein
MFELVKECLASEAAGEKSLIKVIPLLDKNFESSIVDESTREINDDVDEADYATRKGTHTEKRRFTKISRRATHEFPRGTIEMHFMWQPHKAVEHPVSPVAAKVQLSDATVERITPLQKRRSTAGYIQDLTPDQLAAVVAADAVCGMRIMV